MIDKSRLLHGIDDVKDLSPELQDVAKAMEERAYDAVLGDEFKDSPAALALVALMSATGRLLAELGMAMGMTPARMEQQADVYSKLISARMKIEYASNVRAATIADKLDGLATMKPEGHG